MLTLLPSNTGIEVSLRTVFRPTVRGKFLFLKQVMRGKKKFKFDADFKFASLPQVTKCLKKEFWPKNIKSTAYAEKKPVFERFLQ